MNDKSNSTAGDGGPSADFGPMPSIDDFEQRRLFAELEANMFGRSDPVELGRYAVGKRLGSGAMGVVYEAEDPQLQRRVALKVLHPNLRATQASRGHQRLRREARSLSQVSHPNVIEVYDVGEAGGRVYIAMELVDGKSLDKWLTEDQRSWSEILSVFIDAGHGLIAAHASGVIHRDFKPSNVSIDTTGRVRVLDFGLAKAEAGRPITADGDTSADGTEVATREDALVGTPRYMAPEQLQGKPADERSDQYAFCVALFEALYGRVPFDDGRMLASKLAGDRLEPPAGHDVPHRIGAACRRGLQPAAADRFPSMSDLLAALAARRRRWAGWRVAGGLIGAGALAIATLALAPRDQPGVGLGPIEAFEDAGLRQLLARAGALTRDGESARAQDLAAQVLDYARTQSKPGIASEAARRLGYALRSQGQLDESIEVFEMGHAAATEAGDDDSRVELAILLADTTMMADGPAAAQIWVRDAQATSERSELRPKTRFNLYMLETILARQAGEGERALASATKAVELGRRTNDDRLLGALFAQAAVLYDLRRVEDTLEAAHTILEHAESTLGPGHRRTAEAYALLGAIEAETEEFAELSLEHRRHSLELYEAQPDPPLIDLGDGWYAYGQGLYVAGRYREALEAYRRAKEVLQSESSRAEVQSLLATIEGFIGCAMVALGEYEDAEGHLHRALLLFEDVPAASRVGYMDPLIALARTRLERGAVDLARASIDRALSVPDLADFQVGWARYNAAFIEEAAGDLAAAQRHWQACAEAYLRGGDVEGAEFAQVRSQTLARVMAGEQVQP